MPSPIPGKPIRLSKGKNLVGPNPPKLKRKPQQIMDMGPNPPKLKSKPQPMKPLPVDDVMLRKMPITQKQLGQIKKYYGM